MDPCFPRFPACHHDHPTSIEQVRTAYAFRVKFARNGELAVMLAVLTAVTTAGLRFFQRFQGYDFHLHLLTEPTASGPTAQWRHNHTYSYYNRRIRSAQTLTAKPPCQLSSTQSTTSKALSSSTLNNQHQLTCQATRALYGATLRNRSFDSLKTIARAWTHGCGSRSMVGGCGIALVKNIGFAR